MKLKSSGILIQVQILRAIAAGCVVVDHGVSELRGKGFPTEHGQIPWIMGSLGVGVFFVISGLLMIETSYSTLGRPGAAKTFFNKRVIRIIPMYWLFTFFIMAATLAGGHNLKIAAIIKSLFFIPYEGPDSDMRPLLGVGWTLNYEMFFYAIFAISLLLPKRFVISTLFAFFFLLVAIGATQHSLFEVYDPKTILEFWTNPLILLFPVGCGIGLQLRRTTWRLPNLFVPPAALALFVIILTFAIVASTDSVQPIENGLKETLYPLALWKELLIWSASALAVFLCSFASTNPRETFVTAALVLLGNASYSTYLSHATTMRYTARLIGPMITVQHPILVLITFFIAANLVGIFIHRIIEMQLLSLFRSEAHLLRIFKMRPWNATPNTPQKPIDKGELRIDMFSNQSTHEKTASHLVEDSKGKTDLVSEDPVAGASRLALTGRRILIIVENLPVPFDRRVWLESMTLRDAGAQVAVICPIAKGFTAPYEYLNGIHIYRHKLSDEGSNAYGYLKEYAMALATEMRLALMIWRRHGFDVIHACNPPDLIFLVALPFKLIGKKFLFDHHDINPELYEAKFNRRDVFWRVLKVFERLTFGLANVSIATNNSYRQIAIERGKMKPENVFVVRSGPDLARFKEQPLDESLRKGRQYLVGYVGVMGEQEGIDLLLEAVVDLVRRRGRHDIQFCLIGSGPSLKSSQEMAERLEISDYVTFMGRVTDAILLTVLSSSDICVNPDRVNPMNDKSTMNKIIEYMALGKPIVQFDVVEGRYSAGDASLYAKANDPIDFALQIVNLLEDPERRKKMSFVGKERVVNELAWQHQIDPLISAYQKVFS